MGKTPSDKELVGRLREKSPEVLEAEIDVDEVIGRLLKSGPKEEKKGSLAVKLKPRKKLKRAIR